MTLIKEILNEKQWSADVETKWSPPEGFFTKSSSEIAKGLKASSSSYGQAAKRLSFYINRAGKNLTATDLARLEAAKKSLRRLYGVKEDYRISEQTHNMDYNPINSKTVSDIHAVAQKHLAGVANKDAVNKMLTMAYSRGFSAGAAELEGQYKKHVSAVSSKESVMSAIDDAFARGFSAGRSSWQK
jgi:tRNA(adenine34) deaminase